MNRSEVLEGLCEVLSEMLDIAAETITPESDLIRDLDVDSLAVVELAVFSEENYDVDLGPILSEANDADYRPAITVGWLADQIVAAAAVLPAS